MALELTKLVTDMLSAARGVFEEKWPDVKDYAEAEFKKIGECLLMIESLKLQGKITEEQARLHLEIQKNSARTVLLTLEGLHILLVEEAINAALKIIRDAVNTALGWRLV